MSASENCPAECVISNRPAQDIDIYIACDLGDGQLLFYPFFTPDMSRIPLSVPMHFYLDRFALLSVAIPEGFPIDPMHFYCAISSPDELNFLRPIDYL